MESGGGQIRDRGAHVMSNALHFMDADYSGPVSVEAKGTLPKTGLWDTAIDMEVTYEFKIRTGPWSGLNRVNASPISIRKRNEIKAFATNTERFIMAIRIN
jgi:hypothetical protein